MNNISLSTPTPGSATWLEQTLSGAFIKNTNLGPNIIRLQYGDIVQFTFNNGLTGNHPMHFHGHWMW